jgi:glycerophosphoryl diester phosphodiesterase
MMPALRLAHRGDWRRAPENTLPALLAALEIPACDGLEFDVRTSADRVPVLIHDETLGRVQGMPDRVDALTAAEMAAFGIPTLAEVLVAVPRHVFLDIELKGRPSPAVLIVLGVGRGRDLQHAVVSSFEPSTVAWLAAERPDWPRWLNSRDLSVETIDAARGLGCVGISADWRVIDPRTAALVRAAGLTLASWTIRRRPTLRRLERLGASAVCVEGAALDG